jgi:hypothetical protein
VAANGAATREAVDAQVSRRLADAVADPCRAGEIHQDLLILFVYNRICMRVDGTVVSYGEGTAPATR